MRRNLLVSLYCVVLLVSGILAEHITKSGNITSDETWDTDTVLVSGDITVRSGATLTIKPGVVIRTTKTSAPLYNIYISGTGAIYAKGTVTDTIDFRTVPVEFQNLTRDDANLLEYCKFASGWGHSLVEFRNTTTPTTEDVLSHVTIRNCAFYAGGYCQIYITSGASPTVDGCYFTNSQTAIFSHGSDTLTVKNTRFDNVSCAIVCGAMGGMFYEPMVCHVDHCTFVDINDTKVPSYLGPCLGMAICSINEPGELNVTNSIFSNIAGSGIRDWNIEDSNFDENWDVTNDYNIFYQTGGDPCHMMSMGSNSQEVDPKLGSGPEYSLLTGSPAIDAASDASNIGAWQVSAIHDYFSGSYNGHDLGAVSNPFQGTVAFSFPSYDGAMLQIYNSQGQLVKRIEVNHGQVAWDGTDFSGKDLVSGTYYYNLNTENYSVLQMLIKAY